MIDETGGMRRVHLRGHANIRKRLLVHAGGFNLGLLMRQLIGVGTPRGLQGRRFDGAALDLILGRLVDGAWTLRPRFWLLSPPRPPVVPTVWIGARAC